MGKVGKHSIIVHAGASLQRVLIGYVIGSGVGILLGLLMGWYPTVKAIFWPIFSIIRPIPSIAWIPISIIWFGLGENAKIFIVFISSFANLTLNAYSGAKSTDRRLVGAARMLGAGAGQIFFTIVLPGSVPQIFAGLQVAMSSAWATVMAAEMVRSSEGLGWMIVTGMSNNNIEQILTGIVAIGIVGFILAVLMRKAEEVLCRWNKSAV
ncbi:ABC transporter permease [Lacrimispora sp.]|uniref:ABC transporter permease n=1 Tax=Lacrimispora sp. TaxID=2719234 RepID=UPI0034602C9B